MRRTGPEWNEDFEDFLDCFEQAGVEFVIVGAHAMAVHGVPRATGDLGVLVRPPPHPRTTPHHRAPRPVPLRQRCVALGPVVTASSRCVPA